eukprot:199758-Pelagomonas_calceolata.AAC.2
MLLRDFHALKLKTGVEQPSMFATQGKGAWRAGGNVFANVTGCEAKSVQQQEQPKEGGGSDDIDDIMGEARKDLQTPE